VGSDTYVEHHRPVVAVKNMRNAGVIIKLPLTRCIIFEKNSVCEGGTLLFLVDVSRTLITSVGAFVSRFEANRCLVVTWESLVVSLCFSQFIQSLNKLVSIFQTTFIHLEKIEELDFKAEVQVS
jgi:hypothetical protein